MLLSSGVPRPGVDAARALAGATAAWTAGYGVLRAHWAAGGTVLRPRCAMSAAPDGGCVFDRPFDPGPLGGWAAVALSAAGAAVAGTLGRRGMVDMLAACPGARTGLLAGLWTAAVATFDSTLFYHSFDLLKLAGLARGPVDGPLVADRSLRLGAAVLLGLTAWSVQRATRPGCPQCGGPLQPVRPAPAPRWARRTAAGAAAALVPYVLLKEAWSHGLDLAGFAGYPDDFPVSPVDPTVLAGLLGMVFAAALVRPWGERLPRDAVLALGWAGVAPPLGVGLLAAAGAAAMAIGAWSPPADSGLPLPVFLGVYSSFLAVGLLLAATLRSYRDRTAPQCPDHPSVPEKGLPA